MKDDDAFEAQAQPIHPEDLQSGFKSGVHALDSFFQRHAISNDIRGIGRTFVLHSSGESDLPRVIGFYTLSMAATISSALPENERADLPRYPMPVALIGRLAIDHRAQRKGFGERLLGDALRRIAGVSEQIGCIGVIVDAKDESAQNFYARYDFDVFEPKTAFPQRMFMSIETLRNMIADD
jgi:GNAT superfamily N-acetyltransferase